MPVDDSAKRDRPAKFIDLSPEMARRIDEICDVFETQLHTEGRPRIEDFLGGFRGSDRSVLLHELLSLELDNFLAMNVTPDPKGYCRRFPESVDVVGTVFQGIVQSADFTDSWSDPPKPPQTETATLNIPNYHVFERLGEGGMGTVYKAAHTRLGNMAAIKVLRRDRVDDVETVVRFQREMQLVGNLAHPHIVEARDAGRSDGIHYLVMEYVEGLDVGEILRRFGPLPAADACEIARQVAVALQYAHEHNLVHRDIKPSNLLLGHRPQNPEEIQVKVTDLGLARLRGKASIEEHAAQSGHVVGTYLYMAPEQYWAPETVDIRSDVYSLGCTLYALLLGRPPFGYPEYRKPLEIVSAHRDRPVPSFRKLRPDVDESLEEAISWMMAKKPDGRFQTPGELAKSLALFNDGHDLPGLLAQASSLPSPTPGNAAPPSKISARKPKSNDPEPIGSQETITYESAADTPRQDSVVTAESPPSAQSQLKPKTARKSRSAATGRSWRALLWGACAVAALVLIYLAITRFSQLSPTPVDLLALVDPENNAVDTPWEFDGSLLISPDVPRAQLRLPGVPPEEYRLEVEAECVSGGRLVLGLVWRGRQIPVVLDAAVVVLDSAGAAEGQTPPTDLPPELRLGRPSPGTYTCLVRKQGFVVAYEDQLQVAYVAGNAPPPVAADWQLADRNVLFLGSNNSIWRFRKILLTPIGP